MKYASWTLLLLVVSCPIASAQVHFTVNAQQNVNAISPFIYGVQSFQPSNGAYSNLTFSRVGGNRLTAYNWENNASNAGSDWYYQNDNLMSSSNVPGAALTGSLNNARDNNRGIVLTVPMAGYVSADKLGNGDVRYINGNTSQPDPNYLATRFKQSLPAKGSAFTLTPSTTDACVYQDEFVNWVKTNYPTGFSSNSADAKRPIWFALDNEPDLWSSTHAEVHPTPVTYAELVQKTIAYASAIKAVAPNSKVFGPVSYGWHGYTTLQDAPDGAGRDFLTYYLQQMKAADTAAGKRLVDVMDLHWYPEAQGGGVRITGQDTTPAVVAARLQAPRSLWDPTYTETSWITQYSTNGPINLLPRMQGKIDANYPGTKIAITEYNFGGGSNISGGIAQADVLGIFGRQGVFAANVWPLDSDANQRFIAGALQMYRNFDGHNGTFGDTSISANTDDITKSSVYASLDSADPNRMVLIAINKTGQPLTALINLDHASLFRLAHVYQLTGDSSTPVDFGTYSLNDPTSFSYAMPAYSVSTIVMEVPEPATLGLLGSGAGAVLLLWLRRRSFSRN